MCRLYLKIYLTIIASLLLVVLVAGGAMRRYRFLVRYRLELRPHRAALYSLYLSSPHRGAIRDQTVNSRRQIPLISLHQTTSG